MTRHSRIAIVLVCLIAAGSCTRRQPLPPPLPPQPPPPQHLFVLLPDAPGKANAAKVTNSAGSQELTAPNTVVRVRNSTTAPLAAEPIDAAAIRQTFGDALDALPAEEISFVFYFAPGTTALVAESEALLPELLRVARERRSTLISVTGHTDTTGVSRGANQELGLSRAAALVERLRAIGIAPESMLVRSHGQDDPLIATPPNTDEPRNRRVEVIVR